MASDAHAEGSGAARASSARITAPVAPPLPALTVTAPPLRIAAASERADWPRLIACSFVAASVSLSLVTVPLALAGRGCDEDLDGDGDLDAFGGAWDGAVDFSPPALAEASTGGWTCCPQHDVASHAASEAASDAAINAAFLSSCATRARCSAWSKDRKASAAKRTSERG